MKRLAACLLTPILLTACGSEDDSSIGVDLTMGDVEKGVAQLTVTATGGDLTEQAIKVLPVMQMDSGMVHSTPVSNIEGTLDENGEFTTTAYFLMPSMNGTWTVDVTLNEKTHTFGIDVDMMMSDRKVLKGNSSDLVPHMESAVPRSYFLFDQGRHVSDTMNTFSVYISARETLMDYSPITDGAILNAGTHYEYALGTVIVEMCSQSCDNEANWKTAIEDSNAPGKYTASALTLNNDANDSVEVRLSIGGESKTSDGSATGNNATFTFSASNDAMNMM